MSTETNAAKSTLFDKLIDLVLAWFPFLIAFILVPFAMYLPNQIEFDCDLTYVLPFLLLAGMSLAMLTPLMLLPKKFRRTVSKTLFFIGIYMLLIDLIAPLHLGSLMNGPEMVILPESGFREIVQVVLLVVVIMLGSSLPFERLRNRATIFVIVLAITEAAYVGHFLSPDTGIPWIGITKAPNLATKSIASTGNVYQICFDCLSSFDTLDAIKNSGHMSDFDGFVFFKNNRSNYAYTCESMPSYFTGTYFGGGGFKAWDQKRLKSGLIKHLHEAGYEISMYVPKLSYLHETASDGPNRLDLIRGNLDSPIKFQYYDFVDLWLLRLSPAWLGEEIYDEYHTGLFRNNFKDLLNRNLMKKSGDATADRMESLVPSIARLLSTEERRPDHGQYVYVHTYVTHPPWGKRTRNCEFRDLRYRHSSRVDFVHGYCALELMTQIIAKLKQLGRYEESTIIFHSDHCLNIDPNVVLEMPMDVKSRISTILNDYNASSPWSVRTFALLLVKPAGESGTPLKISESPTQLSDIPATIYRILDLPLITPAGKSVFTLSEKEEREIHMFGGFQKNQGAVALFPGKQIFKGSAFHVSFIRGRGWKLYPNIPWHWN